MRLLKTNRRIVILLTIAFTGTISINAQKISQEQNAGILKASQGMTINLEGLLTDKLPLIEYRKIVVPGPQYIISDDPEYIRIPEAVAAREKVQPGSVRLYVYNVN